MLLLTSTSDKLQVVTSAAVTTDVHASWVDNAAGTITPDRKNTAITTAATTDVVVAPAASTQRNVKTLHVRNKHATSSQTVTVKHTDGTTAVELFSATLAAGEEVQYIEDQGFLVLDATGSTKTVQSGTGRYLQTAVLTSGTSFTTGPQTTRLYVRVQAAGGGGGGVSTVASAGGGASVRGAGVVVEPAPLASPRSAPSVAPTRAAAPVGGTVSTMRDLIAALGGPEKVPAYFTIPPEPPEAVGTVSAPVSPVAGVGAFAVPGVEMRGRGTVTAPARPAPLPWESEADIDADIDALFLMGAL